MFPYFGHFNVSFSLILLSNHPKGMYYLHFRVEETEATQLCLLPTQCSFTPYPMPLHIKEMLGQKKKILLVWLEQDRPDGSSVEKNLNCTLQKTLNLNIYISQKGKWYKQAGKGVHIVNSKLIPARKKQMNMVESYQQMRNFNHHHHHPQRQQNMAESTTQARGDEGSLDWQLNELSWFILLPIIS